MSAEGKNPTDATQQKIDEMNEKLAVLPDLARQMGGARGDETATSLANPGFEESPVILFQKTTDVDEHLAFYASGSYQSCVGQDFMVSVSIRAVSEVINTQFFSSYVKFPIEEREIQQIKIAPALCDGHREYRSVNTMGFHFISVQLEGKNPAGVTQREIDEINEKLVILGDFSAIQMGGTCGNETVTLLVNPGFEESHAILFQEAPNAEMQLLVNTAKAYRENISSAMDDIIRLENLGSRMITAGNLLLHKARTLRNSIDECTEKTDKFVKLSTPCNYDALEQLFCPSKL